MLVIMDLYGFKILNLKCNIIGHNTKEDLYCCFWVEICPKFAGKN
jgi:hypothetical protein